MIIFFWDMVYSKDISNYQLYVDCAVDHTIEDWEEKVVFAYPLYHILGDLSNRFSDVRVNPGITKDF